MFDDAGNITKDYHNYAAVVDNWKVLKLGVEVFGKMDVLSFRYT